MLTGLCSIVTNMPPADNFIPFGVVTAVICIPTYLLIGILNSHTGQSSLLALYTRVANSKSEDLLQIGPRRVRSDIGAKPEPSPPIQRRLSRSLSAYEGLASRSAHVSSHPAVLESKDLKRTFFEPMPQPEKVNTVKFNLRPFDSPTPSPLRSATTLDVADTTLNAIKPSSTDPGPKDNISRRSRKFFPGLVDRFSWDEKKESPV
jgi:hypothetical protein